MLDERPFKIEIYHQEPHAKRVSKLADRKTFDPRTTTASRSDQKNTERLFTIKQLAGTLYSDLCTLKRTLKKPFLEAMPNCPGEWDFVTGGGPRQLEISSFRI